MTNEEVNKIIAEFMGYCIRRCGSIHIDENCEGVDFCYSLDLLVPVWEKLKVRDLKFLFNNYAKNKCFIGLEVIEGSAISSSSEDPKLGIQEAAAHATAKAIVSIYNR